MLSSSMIAISNGKADDEEEVEEYLSRGSRSGRHTIECIQRREEAVSTIGVVSGLYIHEMRTKCT
jgi:hypothetical protein